MAGYYETIDQDEPVIHLNTASIHPAAPCSVCGKPDQAQACMRCGKPVCMDPTDYMADSECGSWILDWWHDSAMRDDEDGNEFYCKPCLKEAYGF